MWQTALHRVHWGAGAPAQKLGALPSLSHEAVPTPFPQMLAWAVRQGPHFALPQTSSTDSSSRGSQLTVKETAALLQAARIIIVVVAVLISRILHVNVGFSA